MMHRYQFTGTSTKKDGYLCMAYDTFTGEKYALSDLGYEDLCFLDNFTYEMYRDFMSLCKLDNGLHKWHNDMYLNVDNKHYDEYVIIGSHGTVIPSPFIEVMHIPQGTAVESIIIQDTAEKTIEFDARSANNGTYGRVKDLIIRNCGNISLLCMSSNNNFIYTDMASLNNAGTFYVSSYITVSIKEINEGMTPVNFGNKCSIGTLMIECDSVELSYIEYLVKRLETGTVKLSGGKVVLNGCDIVERTFIECDNPFSILDEFVVCSDRKGSVDCIYMPRCSMLVPSVMRGRLEKAGFLFNSAVMCMYKGKYYSVAVHAGTGGRLDISVALEERRKK